MGRRRQSGFTLIEMMLVAAIIGLLASIAIPKFANMIRKAQEAALKGDLGALRSAMTLYYADNEGLFPLWGGRDLTPKYIQNIPTQRVPFWPGNAAGSGNRWTTVEDLCCHALSSPNGFIGDPDEKQELIARCRRRSLTAAPAPGRIQTLTPRADRSVTLKNGVMSNGHQWVDHFTPFRLEWVQAYFNWWAP